MKKLYSLLVAAAFLFSASASAQVFKLYKNNVVIGTYTIEDVDSIVFTPAKKKVTFEGDYFTALIDNPQYMGPLLYPDDEYDPEEDGLWYSWEDDKTTLGSGLTNAWGGYYGYAEGGVAISNYIDANLANGDYEHQLAVPVSNGTDNFAVVFCTAYLTFKEASVIESMDVIPTTYTLNVMKNGNSMAQPLTDAGSFLTVVATGYVSGEKTTAIEFDLARDGQMIEDWTTVDFSALGAADSIVFTMVGSDAGSCGLNTPAYFAIDNVVIGDQPQPVVSDDQVTFEGSYFTALIDNPQYMGPQLYPQGDEAQLYTWKDETTTLGGGVTNSYGDLQYWGGGIAISNYIDANLANGDYEHQLAVPVSNGTDNFAVVFCTASLTLDEAKVIKSMDIVPTTYTFNVMKNGNSMAHALTDAGSFLTVVATGYNGNEEPQVLKFDLARDGVFVEDWTTVDFSALGAVTKIEFTMEGSDTGDWGLNTPQYFAIDNVVIKK